MREEVRPRPTATWVPRACRLTAASGESSAPTVSSVAPRRAASAASASGPAARPDSETATTRSSGPTQPGSGQVAPDRERHRGARAGQQSEHITDQRRAAERGDEDRARAVAGAEAVGAGLGRQGDGLPHLRPGRGQRPQHLRGSRRGQCLGVVQPGLVELHQARPAGPHPRPGPGLVDQQDRDAVVDPVGQAALRRRCSAARASRSGLLVGAAPSGSSGRPGSPAATARSTSSTLPPRLTG